VPDRKEGKKRRGEGGGKKLVIRLRIGREGGKLRSKLPGGKRREKKNPSTHRLRRRGKGGEEGTGQNEMWPTQKEKKAKAFLALFLC